MLKKPNFKVGDLLTRPEFNREGYQDLWRVVEVSDSEYDLQCISGGIEGFVAKSLAIFYVESCHIKANFINYNDYWAKLNEI